jgi:nucleoside 2-deoxyribosyltransferase
MRWPNAVNGSKPKLYFAAPLFSEAELQFNERVAEVLARFFDVYLPQRDGGLLAEMVKLGMAPKMAATRVFTKDIRAIEDADVLLALLDGRTVDEGVAFELGVAFATGKRCIGLQTDVRRELPTGNNPMIDEAVEKTFSAIDDLVAWAAEEVPATVCRHSCSGAQILTGP